MCYMPDCERDTSTERTIDGAPQGLCVNCATAFDCGNRQLDRHRNVAEAVRELMIEDNDWIEQRSGADVIEALSIILDVNRFGPTPEAR